MKRLVIIDSCNHCPNFDNEYWGYAETCVILNRRIEHPDKIPEDCPLERVENE